MSNEIVNFHILKTHGECDFLVYNSALVNSMIKISSEGKIT